MILHTFFYIYIARIVNIYCLRYCGIGFSGVF